MNNKKRLMQRDGYYIGVGRDKEATARVYLKEGTGQVRVNGKDIVNYFYMDPFLAEYICWPLKLFNKEKKYDLLIRVKGSGYKSQADASRLGVAKAYLEISSEYKTTLKSFGLLTRDPRRVEPKKIGFKKARKKEQFSKR